MATPDPAKYKYERNSDGTWERLETVKDFKRMSKSLNLAYLDPDLILASMHGGLVVRTPFAAYRATVLTLVDRDARIKGRESNRSIDE